MIPWKTLELMAGRSAVNNADKMSSATLFGCYGTAAEYLRMVQMYLRIALYCQRRAARAEEKKRG